MYVSIKDSVKEKQNVSEKALDHDRIYGSQIVHI